MRVLVTGANGFIGSPRAGARAAAGVAAVVHLGGLPLTAALTEAEYVAVNAAGTAAIAKATLAAGARRFVYVSSLPGAGPSPARRPPPRRGALPRGGGPGGARPARGGRRAASTRSATASRTPGGRSSTRTRRRRAGGRASSRRRPSPTRRPGGRASKLPGRPLPLSPDQIDQMRQRYWVCDNEAIERDLGWRPTLSIEEGMAQTLAWYREHGWL